MTWARSAMFPPDLQSILPHCGVFYRNIAELHHLIALANRLRCRQQTRHAKMTGGRAREMPIITDVALIASQIGLPHRSMSMAQLKNATAAALIFSLGAMVMGEAWAKPSTMALPLPNPKRLANPARQAIVPLPVRNPGNKLELPKPQGPIAKVPQLLKYKLSEADKIALKETIRAIYKRKFSIARKTMGKIKDQTANKLARWYYYRRRGNDADATLIESFRQENPDWPSQRRMQRNAEAALLFGKTSPEKILQFFAESKPQTGAGKAALAGAYMSAGETEKASLLISSAWRKHTLDSNIEKLILAQYGKLLTPQDHKARVDRLLLLDRKSKIPAVKRTAALLDKKENEKIKARIAVVRRLRVAKKLLAKISEEDAKGDVGFYFSRIQWLRRHKKKEEAWKLLMAAPNEPDALIALNEWWIERRINCRAALHGGQPEIAYHIASNHGPLTGGHYYEAEFLAGWVALRSLAKPEIAKDHFLALRNAASGEKTIAKSEYWLGRVFTALNDTATAETHFQNAAKYPLTYYGQLSAQTLSPGKATLPLPASKAPTEDDFAKFKQRGTVKVIGLVKSVGLEKLAPLFFNQMARTMEEPGQAKLLAELALAMKLPQSSVRLAKIAFNRGLPLADYAYPTNMMPEYKEINVPVERALLYSLSRQESEFNPIAKSPAGARGLMQIMPRTARAIARQHKVRYRRSSLTKNPSYNVMLGVAHLGDFLASYNGSYILTLVAYNAGGGRVRNWTEEFGDPRKRSVDAIDWVEKIPFTETRNYVKKILTGAQIFRARLNGPEGALQLVEDMNRGQSDDAAAVSQPPPTN